MTSIEFLENKLKTYLSWSSFLEEDFEQAKEMEKQQIIDAYAKGSNDRLKNVIIDYYNETYGSKGSDVTSSQTEISDEEIEKAFTVGYGFQKTVYTDRIEGAKWYREQLKQKL